MKRLVFCGFFVALAARAETDPHGASGVAVLQPMLSFHGGAEVEDDRMWFQARFQLANRSGAPFMPAGGALLIPLPAGSESASIVEEAKPGTFKLGNFKYDSTRGIVRQGVIPPGQEDFVVEWTQRFASGELRFDLSAPYGIVDGQLAVEDFPGLAIKVIDGSAVLESKESSGRKFWVLGDIDRRPGEALRLVINGLPSISRTERALSWLALALTIGLLGWALVALLVPSRRKGDSNEEGRLHEVHAELESLYEALVSLEKGRGAGLDEEKYRRERNTITSRLALVHRELDMLSGEGKRVSSGA